MGSKYTNDFVPIKAITNGMIILENNQKVTGIKVLPKNIFILESDVQAAIINNLRNVYNTIDYEFWLICADRPVDINLFLSQLQLLYNNVQSQIKRKLILEDINKANMFMNNNVVDTEYLWNEYDKVSVKVDPSRIKLTLKGEIKNYVKD